MVNDTTRLLGLDGVVVERVEVGVTGVPVVDPAALAQTSLVLPDPGLSA